MVCVCEISNLNKLFIHHRLNRQGLCPNCDSWCISTGFYIDIICEVDASDLIWYLVFNPSPQFFIRSILFLFFNHEQRMGNRISGAKQVQDIAFGYRSFISFIHQGNACVRWRKKIEKKTLLKRMQNLNEYASLMWTVSFIWSHINQICTFCHRVCRFSLILCIFSSGTCFIGLVFERKILDVTETNDFFWRICSSHKNIFKSNTQMNFICAIRVHNRSVIWLLTHRALRLCRYCLSRIPFSIHHIQMSFNDSNLSSIFTFCFGDIHNSPPTSTKLMLRLDKYEKLTI